MRGPRLVLMAAALVAAGCDGHAVLGSPWASGVLPALEPTAALPIVEPTAALPGVEPLAAPPSVALTVALEPMAYAPSPLVVPPFEGSELVVIDLAAPTGTKFATSVRWFCTRNVKLGDVLTGRPFSVQFANTYPAFAEATRDALAPLA